jgi:hypothetical protein
MRKEFCWHRGERKRVREIERERHNERMRETVKDREMVKMHPPGIALNYLHNLLSSILDPFR